MSEGLTDQISELECPKPTRFIEASKVPKPVVAHRTSSTPRVRLV